MGILFRYQKNQEQLPLSAFENDLMRGTKERLKGVHGINLLCAHEKCTANHPITKDQGA